jgi:hypothetical protein
VATFLELCGKLAQRSGAVGSAPASVLNQTGRQAKVVDWVRTAWEMIQTEDNPDWNFLRGEFSQALSPNIMSYTPAALGIPSFGRWIPATPEYQPMSIYPAGAQDQECELRYIDYSSWRATYNRGVHDAMKPTYWSIAPDRSFLVGPKPDQAYVVRGEYQRGAQTLVADGDVPIMPDEYHDAIVWRAAVLLAEHDEAPVARQTAVLNYDPLFRSMSRDLLPAFELGGNAIG